MTPAICVESISKLYRINHAAPAGDLRSAVVNAIKAPWQRLRQGAAHSVQSEEFWALQDINFTVNPGEIVGVVGRNGAGKSTLLKILSQITEPSAGRVALNGRVGSLLEVGTGFHPELTGRENIFLNGVILGMSRREIQRKFDEIVEFSGVERFLDTPVKRYSSGMHVRLGFAVAAHLEPEILIVDEVLAVGDAAFQKRCLGKMKGVAREGRTVLFVSHNMQAVSMLCERALLLVGGRVRMLGATEEVVDEYLSQGGAETAAAEWDELSAPGDEATRLRAVRVLNEAGVESHHHDMHHPITLELEFDVLKSLRDVSTSFHVHNQQEVCLFAVSDFQDPDWRERTYLPGRYRARCRIPGDFLNEGRHLVSAYVVKDKAHWPAHCKQAVSFVVHDYGRSRGGYTGHWIGAVRPVLPWVTEKTGDVA